MGGGLNGRWSQLEVVEGCFRTDILHMYEY